MEQIASYVATRVDPAMIGGSFGYTGILPPLSNRTDFKTFPTGYFPFIGVSPQSIDYFDESVGTYYPKLDIQVSFSQRSPGIGPEEDIPIMLDYVQQLETILVDAVRVTRFEMPDVIQALQMIDCIMYPTFYTQVESDRKAFQIGVFSMRLYLGVL
jgi:hypothetical protein